MPTLNPKTKMKILIAGGNGLIGKKLAVLLERTGNEVVAASRSSGVDLMTGKGLDAAIRGVDAVVDVLNSPSFEDQAVLEFFQATTTHLLQAEAATGVKHHVALSVVGSDRVPDSGYLRAKSAQENLIKAANVPFTILRATQFFEFAPGIAQFSVVDGKYRLPTALMQPVAANDVAACLGEVVSAAPRNGILELGGPEKIRLHEFVDRYLKATEVPHMIEVDPTATYFGAAIDDRSLVPQGHAVLGNLRYQDWLENLRF